MKHDDDEERRKRIVAIVVVVLLAIAIIITLGLLFRREKIRKIEEAREKKLKRLNEIEARITYLLARKDKIEKKEKWILISARIIVALLLVMGNLWYQKYFITPFNFPESLGDFLNINGIVLMFYAFVGFIFYGTVGNLVQAMKSKLARVLRRNDIDSLEELDALILERDLLRENIKELDRQNDELK